MISTICPELDPVIRLDLARQHDEYIHVYLRERCPQWPEWAEIEEDDAIATRCDDFVVWVCVKGMKKTYRTFFGALAGTLEQLPGVDWGAPLGYPLDDLLTRLPDLIMAEVL